jgi:hypothetical protein
MLKSSAQNAYVRHHDLLDNGYEIFMCQMAISIYFFSFPYHWQDFYQT